MYLMVGSGASVSRMSENSPFASEIPGPNVIQSNSAERVMLILISYYFVSFFRELFKYNNLL